MAELFAVLKADGILRPAHLDQRILAVVLAHSSGRRQTPSGLDTDRRGPLRCPVGNDKRIARTAIAAGGKREPSVNGPAVPICFEHARFDVASGEEAAVSVGDWRVLNRGGGVPHSLAIEN